MGFHSIKSSLLGAAAVIALSAASVTPAIAQEDATTRLGEVIVTATKQEENLQDLASSVAALSGDKLDVFQSGGTDLRFLSARVPSVYVESSFGRFFPRFYIRGLGNTDFDYNASQPVSMVYDQVVLENPTLKGPVFDVQAVEVLRGPQGTLFGRNTPAGIIKVDSVKPSQDFGGYARASYGTHNSVEVEGAVGGGLTETLSGRISGKFQSRDDFVDNAFTGEDDVYEGYDDFAWRAQLLYEPTDRFSALFNVHGRELDGTARLFRANTIEPGTNELVDNFDRDTVFYDSGDGNPQDLSTYGASVTLEYDFGNDISVTSITGYEGADSFSRADVDGGFGATFLGDGNFGPNGGIPFDADTSDAVDALTQITQEIRFASDSEGPFNWQAGAYFFSEDIKITTENYEALAPGTPVDGFVLQNQNTEAFAVFASGTYEFAEKWSATAGLRFTDEEKDFSAIRTIAPLAAPFLGGQEPSDGFLTTSVGDDEISWDVSLTYAATEDVNVYGRIARGFRAPAIQGRILFAFGDGGVSVGDSETLTSYEAGVKSELYDGRARFNFSAFYYEIEDQQLTAIGGASNSNALVNADKGVGKGFEAELEVLPSDSLLLTAGLSFNDTEIQDDELLIAPCGAPCFVLDPIDTATGFAQVDGNSFPNAPEWILTWTARYGVPVGNHGEVFVFTDWNYRSDVNFFLYESVEFSEDAYWEGGLRVGYASNDGYELAVFARNIMDEERKTGAIDFNNLTSFVNEGRFFGAEAKVNF